MKRPAKFTLGFADTELHRLKQTRGESLKKRPLQVLVCAPLGHLCRVAVGQWLSNWLYNRIMLYYLIHILGDHFWRF